MKKTNIPYLKWSIEDIDYTGVTYLGTNTNGTILFFDNKTGSVYKYNPHSMYFRREAKHIDRVQLVTKKRVAPREFTRDFLMKYVNKYRTYRYTKRSKSY